MTCLDANYFLRALVVPTSPEEQRWHQQAKQLFDELWTEQRPLPNAGDDTEDSEDDEPGEHEHPYDVEETHHELG